MASRSGQTQIVVFRTSLRRTWCVSHDLPARITADSEIDAIIYAVTGPGFLLTHSGDEDAEPKRNELSAGDFAFVPPWTEHQMVNETDNEITWVVIQSASEPLQVDLTEWGGAEIKHTK